MRQFEVIIPVRNGGLALVNSIQSVLSGGNASQIQLTLSDNFSTDGSPWREALEQFPKEQWRIISPPQPLSRVEHWSWAFAQTQSPWAKPLMSGDRIENAFWTWASKTSTQFPAAGILFAAACVLDPSSAHPAIPPDGGRFPADSFPYELGHFERDAVRGFNRMGALSQVLFRAEVLRSALPFSPAFPWTADWRLYQRCLEQAPAAGTTARLVCLDRSIARLSTSWKGVRGSFREEWRFAAEQAARTKAPAVKSFLVRCRVLGVKMSLVVGKRILPRGWRRFLTAATGLHQKNRELLQVA